MPIEIIAYTTGIGENIFGELDVFRGTQEELASLRKIFFDTCESMGGITVLYDGDDMVKAKEAIKGLPWGTEEL